MRSIALGLTGTAITASTLFFSATTANAATSAAIGPQCPAWESFVYGIPTGFEGKGDLDLMVATGNASSADGAGVCVAAFFGGSIGNIFEVGIANPSSGPILFYGVGGAPQIVPLIL